MAHFTLETAINDATKMDAPIQRGPLMRWQRKAAEAGVKSLSLEGGLNVSGLSGPLSNMSGPRSSLSLSSKTPGITPRSPLSSKTPGRGNVLNSKTPNKTPGKKSVKIQSAKTPNRNSTTPHRSKSMDALDRFIPNRSAMDMEASHFHVTNTENVDPSEETEPSTAEYQRKLSEALADGQPQGAKILSYKQKAPQTKEGHMNNLKVLYSGTGHASSSTQKAANARQIPQQPERILDAPELLDDYYLNLMDWSANNHMAIALGPVVYLWNASNGSINQLMELENPEEYVSSVSWIKEGNILGIGNSLGAIQLWDVGQQKLVRTMAGHPARVGALDWNSYILSSGSRTGQIYHHDVRVPQHKVATLQGHNQEVCGLAWSPDGKHLASGANDNLLNIWDTTLGHPISPIHTFTHHQSAVKALAWCPWQSSLLASGGGTADRHIRFWNVTNGTCVNSVDTNSQVCSILWSKDYKELISGHGYSNNQLTIWKYPSMVRVAELTGHTARILCLTMSPDGSTVASAAADETLRLWKCFQVDKQRKPSVSKSGKPSSSVLSKGIR